ncbi:phosphoribosyltransferase [Croceicoccus marinus]|uniref:phosphoribosyltransferase n=1 Tax=Croceicoccus marinus TaxID=450378 RepID=UPI001FD31408
MPSDIDLIVGIPRSGILAGITVALLKNIRFTDLDSLIEGRLSGVGSTKMHAGLVDRIADVRHALVIDDSLNRGFAMQEAKERLAELRGAMKLTFAVVYAVPDAGDEIDFFFEAIPLPRLFEWNFSHHSYLSRSCVIMDAVICETIERTDQNEADYRHRLLNAAPVYQFTAPIGCLITRRAERYRPETEAWLRGAGIQYDRLVMHDGAHSLGVGENDAFVGFTAEIYKSSKSILLIESNFGRSKRIAFLSGKPVLSVDEHKIVQPDCFAFITAKQKVVNALVNAEIGHSPLVNRQAFRRKVRRIFPSALFRFAKGVIAYRSRKASR